MALKQWAAELLFEGANARSHVRLDGVKFGCGAVHAAEPRHRLECL
jgi:hypothetical protein